MLTQGNTQGFTDEELERMNKQVDNLLELYYPELHPDSPNYIELLKWAEETVLNECED